MPMAWRIVRAAVVFGVAGVLGLETRGEEMTYGTVRGFLGEHTRVVELSGERGARVAVCPEWQGRVMTSTCGGDDGVSFGFVNRSFIEAGKHDPQFNNYGAEDRMWLSPEGGRFSLWFAPGAAQTLANWQCRRALNAGPTRRPARRGRLLPDVAADAAAKRLGSAFDLAVTAKSACSAAKTSSASGGPPGRCHGGVRVAYETVNSIRNCGPTCTAMTEWSRSGFWACSMRGRRP